MTEALIYDAVRTPRGRGKPGGALHEVTSVELAAGTLRALRERTALDTERVDDLALGCVEPVGEQGGNIARAAALAAGYAPGVPGVQVNRFCGSGLEAVCHGAAMIMAGQADLAIGGGVESMSRVPMGASGGAWLMDPSIAIPAHIVPQGVAADLIATRCGFSRRELDAYAVESHRRAAAAWAGGHFARSVVGVIDASGLPILDTDQHVRADASLEAMAALPPAFAQMGALGFDSVITQRYVSVEQVQHVHHAGNSSGIVDGAAAILLGSRQAGDRLGKRARARIRAFASVGSEPSIMLTGPLEATRKVLRLARMGIADIELFEVNEAFAAVPLMYLAEFGLAPDQVNPNGGAIAMGHPLGATGAILLNTLIDELERQGKGVGLVTLCVAAGMGIAAIVERV